MDQLLDMPNEQLAELMHSRARRRFSRGLKRKPLALIQKLRKAKKEAPPLEKPAIVKTHLRDMIIVPEMVGSIVGIYNGKTFNQVSIEASASVENKNTSNDDTMTRLMEWNDFVRHRFLNFIFFKILESLYDERLGRFILQEL